jgi:hypothetical protein
VSARPGLLRPRDGSALLLAVLVLLLVDCMVIGTLQIARLERRLAGAAVDLLTLRLEAEGALAVVVAEWPAMADSLAPGRPALRIAVEAAAPGHAADAELEALAGGVYVIRGRARREPPQTGAAAAAVLVLPPALPPSADAAPAAVSAQALSGTGTVSAAAAPGCLNEPRPAALLVQHPVGNQPDIEGYVDVLDPADALPGRLTRIQTAAIDAPGVLIEDDVVVEGHMTGVLITTYDATLIAGGRLDGLLIAGGTVRIDEGAVLHGAVHAGGAVKVDGHMQLDVCRVEEVVRASGLKRVRALRHRPAIPPF